MGAIPAINLQRPNLALSHCHAERPGGGSVGTTRSHVAEEEEEDGGREGVFKANTVNEEEEGEEEEEEKGLFKANAVDEEDPERDRATPA